ncbi:hypothetical protein [Novosphingobium sp. AP12]|uniref:hypothetical protein n=1 Tax=Novosphingobium sp. AP12 TaxID=1144305 RepID=UPI001EE652E5|nr:hypothetical protein [Novosphingobium sp. AP12]
MPVIEKPTPLSSEWIDPPGFPEALNLHIKRHGESYYQLHKALVHTGEKFTSSTLKSWLAGKRSPGSADSLLILARIEGRYRLPAGYFKAKLPHSRRVSQLAGIDGISKAEQRRLAWHLPDDFAERSRREQAEILDWIRTVVISGATDYRRYQAKAMRDRYGVRFPALTGRRAQAVRNQPANDGLEVAAEAGRGGPDAPPQLLAEMRELIRFKTATLTDVGFQRSGVWGGETTAQKIEHFGLMFGALAASPKGAVAGLGVPLGQLSFALLIFPRVWDWYVQWREQRRGFFTLWEADMLRNAMAMVRSETGWIRQHPELANRLAPIAGLVSEDDVAVAKSDWGGACERLHVHVLTRVKEVERVARVHRDPFEPILPILEAPSPVAEYLKIAEEVLKHRPDARRHPRAAAEVTRSYLILRLGLHLGLRQKNLRQLMVCPKAQQSRTERQLETLKRGELRWSDRDQGWEVLVPSAAFKNAHSSFFSGKPFRLVLPDLGGLYDHIDMYLRQDRALLLNGADDPGTFFVKSAKATSRDAAYDQNTFYEAWRLITQRYGVFNPYTGRGAIRGLLPHGPHNVRDVLATHILKQTGSYEQASYGIQDTPDTVAKHYGRFLPQDKSAMAAQVLNRVWEAA